jgi:hypothetical protein
VAKRIEVALAWFFLIGAIVAWPTTQLTIARDEPPFTLGLSWLAIILTAADFLKSSRVHRDQDDSEHDAT